MFIERKLYPIGNDKNAISYEIHDDNGHTIQLTPTQVEELAQQLEERKSQIFHDVNGTEEEPLYDETPDLTLEHRDRQNELDIDDPNYVYPEDRD